MKKTLLAGACLILTLSVSAGSVITTAADPRIARGKYLVEQVAMCIDCHTPRDQKGQFIRERWLQGGPLDFQPVHPMPIFASNAPGIAGLPGWTEAEAVKLLQTGLGLEGKPLRPPMPMYKMSKADAAAVVAYLKSLKPLKK